VDSAVVSAVKQSFGRALGNAKMMSDFYDAFISSHPEMAKKFAATDMDRQREILKQSLSMAILFPQDNIIATQAMTRVRDSHSRDKLDIAPELYDYWLDALIGVVRNSDPEFTPLLEEQWRELLSHVIEFIRGGH